MKASVNFQFKSGHAINFSFELNEENVKDVSASMVRNFEKKIFLLQSKAAKYFKKSNVLSHRKFEMSLYMQGKYVKTCYSGIETSNGLLKDSLALEELLVIMLFDGIDTAILPEIAELS